jgi:signal transduction histidine kinase
VPPRTAVTRIDLSGGQAKRTLRFAPPGPLEIAPGERSASFEVASLDLTNPARNLYRFRLEGHDDAWSDPSPRRIATFTRLSPGRYVFHARSSNADGVWNREGLAIPLVVHPAVWETRWFRGLILVGAIALAAGAHRLRLRSIRRQKERLERLVRQRTSELEERRREAERQRQRQEMVNRIVHLIHEEVELAPLLRAILEGLSFAGAAERSLALVPREEGGHQVVASSGWVDGSLDGAELPEGDLRAYLDAAGEPAPGIFVGPPTPSRLLDLELERDRPSLSVVAMEIVADATTLGMLLLQNTRSQGAFSATDVETLQQLRPHVTSAFLKGRILDELRHLNEQKNEFLGMAAHDLRSPLGGVISQIDLLHRFLEEERMDRELWERFLTSVRRTAEGMLRLIEDLLDVAAIESGRVELHLEPFPLRRLLEERRRIHEIVAADKTIQLDVVSPPESLRVRGDEPRIAEILDNLLSNAIKFTPPGGAIRVTTEAVDGRIHVHVRDTGPGLSPEELPQLFTGRKLSPRPTGGEPSTGLGLVITKRLVELHGGQIWVESTLGEGSVFSFSLPRALGV